jgi:hypothetical protein
MDTTKMRFVGAGAFFLFIFLSGFWLSRSGKPYSALVFNIHKLIGLATGAFLVTMVYRIHQASPLNGVEITTIVVTVLIVIATVTAGGLLSIDKPMPAAISVMHKVFPYFTVLSTVITLYLLLNRKM